jgi:hypothetical protein
MADSLAEPQWLKIMSNNIEGKPTMNTWSKDELLKISEADDLHISPFREDGATEHLERLSEASKYDPAIFQEIAIMVYPL